MKNLTYLQFIEQYRNQGMYYGGFGDYMVRGRYSEHDSAKGHFAKETKKRLREVAKSLGLTTKDYDLRFNAGGFAVSGEVTLHTDSLYVQVSIPFIGLDEILYRKCNNRKDYVGWTNHYTRIDMLEQPERLVELLNKL